MSTNATPNATPFASTTGHEGFDTALDRLVDKATAGTKEAIDVAEQALAQRDELAACLREVKKVVNEGTLVLSGISSAHVMAFVRLELRIDAALARIPDQKEKA